MKAKHQRLLWITVSLAFMASALAATLYQFRDNLVFFVTPTELAKKIDTDALRDGQVFRLGGLVKTGSIVQVKPGEIEFIITDLTRETTVHYRGIIPALFREGQGCVVEGSLTGDVFQAQSLLAKHDENYMPQEVVQALKKSGRWQHYGTTPDGTPIHTIPAKP
jgi:cytochrome c-type biogenesis protein CcmE